MSGELGAHRHCNGANLLILRCDSCISLWRDDLAERLVENDHSPCPSEVDHEDVRECWFIAARVDLERCRECREPEFQLVMQTLHCTGLDQRILVRSRCVAATGQLGRLQTRKDALLTLGASP